MSRPTRHLTAAAPLPSQMEVVSGNASNMPAAFSASTSVYGQKVKTNHKTDRMSIAQPWQIEAYRHVNICGEARASASLFAHIAARAELGVSEPNSLGRKPVWVNQGPEVDVLAEIAPTVRERKKLIRDYMTHHIIAGESYLIARDRVDTDPEYALRAAEPVWEIVGVTELQKIGNGEGSVWRVRHDNGNYIDLASGDPIIRMWNPDPENRREAWSPFRSMLSTLREIEWLTLHIFTQVRSRLMSAGVWFLPENITFAPPPADAVEGGAEAIAQMNDAEKFMVSLAASSMNMLDADEVSFPTVVMADAAALASVDQAKLIKFWSDIDDKAMVLRSDAVRRFALGMDLPPEQVLGSSGLAVSGTSGSAGSVNHWGEWAKEEQTISNHVEPALDGFVGALTVILRTVVEGTAKVIAYDTATLRSKQDRSKEAMEWYDRGQLKAEVALRETGFDPENDMMDDAEFKRWILIKIAGGSATPEQVQESLKLLGVVLQIPVSGNTGDTPTPELPAPRQPGRNNAPSLEDHPYQGPPRVQHDHSPAPYSALHASAEVLVLRALEKAGNRVLNDGKRGRDRDRTTPPHLAHLSAGGMSGTETMIFDFDLLGTVLSDVPASRQVRIEGALVKFCRNLYRDGDAYTRDGLIAALEGL